MKDITKQTQKYERMLELAAVPLLERRQVMVGAALFFSRGGPNNHFTVGMAARAGTGLVPPVYVGLGSEERYFQTKKPPTYAPESVSQLAAHDHIVPNCRRDTQCLLLGTRTPPN